MRRVALGINDYWRWILLSDRGDIVETGDWRRVRWPVLMVKCSHICNASATLYQVLRHSLARSTYCAVIVPAVNQDPCRMLLLSGNAQHRSSCSNSCLQWLNKYVQSDAASSTLSLAPLCNMPGTFYLWHFNDGSSFGYRKILPVVANDDIRRYEHHINGVNVEQYKGVTAFLHTHPLVPFTIESTLNAGDLPTFSLLVTSHMLISKRARS